MWLAAACCIASRRSRRLCHPAHSMIEIPTTITATINPMRFIATTPARPMSLPEPATSKFTLC